MSRNHLLISACLLACFAQAAWSQVTESVTALEEVGVDEKLNALLPLDLVFIDSSGRETRLGDVFQAGRPFILSLNYSDCPMLCQLQLTGLVNSLRDLRWDVGDAFDVISVSIDPLETPTRARQSKQRYVREYGRASTAAGWHFLTGSQEAIDQLTDTVGFRYRYVPERGEYAHAAVIMVCSPNGRVSRYLYGVDYPPATLKTALVEAGEGKIGTTLDRVLLYCFHYDPSTGRYAPTAIRVMQLGAAITMATIFAGLLPSWLRGKISRTDGRQTASASMGEGEKA